MTDHATPRFIGIHAAEFVVVRLGVSIPGVYITQCRLLMQRSRTVGQDLNKIYREAFFGFVIVNLLWLNSFIISRTFFMLVFSICCRCKLIIHYQSLVLTMLNNKYCQNELFMQMQLMQNIQP